jgi:steroid delta-isomerase-like uncharacterized protein
MPETPATSNKEAVARFCDAMNTGSAELIAAAIDDLVAPDAVIRTPLPIDATGATALKEVFARLHQVYSDLRVIVEDVIEEGDKVVVRNTVTGTHQGEYMGLPATGNLVSYDEIFIFRFAGGRIVETWGVVDVFAQMKQLGLVHG